MDNDTGGGGGSQYVPPAFSDIVLAPEDLADFARQLQDDVAKIKSAWDQLRTGMENQPNPNFPGGYGNDISYANGYPEVLDNASPGIREGQEFTRAYFLTLGAERMLMDDVIRGFETLQQAATMIHNDYLASDASNASSLEGAFAAYERAAVVEALGEPTPEHGGGSTHEPS